MAERFLKLRFQLPAGVVVRTRTDTPNSKLGTLDHLFGGFTMQMKEFKSNTTIHLELDIPEAEFDQVLAALHAAKA
jgi:hypothetical protein